MSIVIHCHPIKYCMMSFDTSGHPIYIAGVHCHTWCHPINILLIKDVILSYMVSSDQYIADKGCQWPHGVIRFIADKGCHIVIHGVIRSVVYKGCHIVMGHPINILLIKDVYCHTWCHPINILHVKDVILSYMVSSDQILLIKDVNVIRHPIKYCWSKGIVIHGVIRKLLCENCW